MSESNADLARRGFEAVVRGDFEVIADLLDPAVKWHGGDPAAEGACRNRGQALEVMRQAVSRHAIGELVDVIEAGDKVVVILRPVSEAGVSQRPVANLATFREGKVVEMVHYPDPGDAFVAAGRRPPD